MLAGKDLIKIAMKVGMAVGEVYGDVIVASDTRTTGDAVKHAFISGVLAAGAACYDTGVAPTPTLAIAAREFKAGAMITASHNPPEYNGIKLLNPDGSAFNPEQQHQIEEIVTNDSVSVAPWGDIHRYQVRNGYIEVHIKHILSRIPSTRRLKVVLDCGCGAGSVITPELLKRMGCEVIALNSFPTGFFPREIEPTEDNLQTLIQATGELGADLGIAHDGDADRMMAVDDRGRFIPGDKLLTLFACQVNAKEVVTTLDASMVVDEMDFSITRTRIGDTCVSEQLKNGGDFGGEPSGSWIFSENSLSPDGIYAAARLVTIAGQEKLSRLVDEIPQYPILRGSVDTYGMNIPDYKKHLLALEPLSVENIDGIKLNYKDGWILVRPSGTEPKIRITAEAKSEERAKELYNSAVQAIEEIE